MADREDRQVDRRRIASKDLSPTLREECRARVDPPWPHDGHYFAGEDDGVEEENISPPDPAAE